MDSAGTKARHLLVYIDVGTMYVGRNRTLHLPLLRTSRAFRYFRPTACSIRSSFG